jgi:protein-disulfide isomerase
MRSKAGQLLIVMVAASLGACSRTSEAPAAPLAAAQPAPAPAPEAAPAALTPDLTARLIRPHSPVIGSAKAPVTVVEVLDPACEACKAFAPVVHQILFLYPEDVRVVVRFADFHPGSEQAIRLLEAARLQGKFEPLLDALFERQEEWSSHSAPNPARIWDIAKGIGVNVKKAKTDVSAASVDKVLRIEAEDLVALKVERTPTFFVNGKPLLNFGDQQLLDLVASEVKAQKR